jgi:hypothetical protein
MYIIAFRYIIIIIKVSKSFYLYTYRNLFISTLFLLAERIFCLFYFLFQINKYINTSDSFWFKYL